VSDLVSAQIDCSSDRCNCIVKISKADDSTDPYGGGSYGGSGSGGDQSTDPDKATVKEEEKEADNPSPAAVGVEGEP
jgi:hypothetical protein